MRQDRRPSFERSIETQLCYSILKEHQGEGGAALPYEMFEDKIGISVRQGGVGYAALKSAREIALRDDGMVWDTPGDGLVHLRTDAEIVRGVPGDIRRVRRTVDRKRRRLMVANNTQGLNDDEKTMRVAALSLYELMRRVARPKAIERVRGAVNATDTDQLPIGRTMELFKR